jgi:maleate isomerase
VESINNQLAKFLTAEGFDVVNIRGLGMLDDSDINNLSPQVAYKPAKEVDTAEAEGVLISCTSIRTFEVIDFIKKDLGKPFIGSNQATFWNVLRMAGLKDIIEGCDKLFNY